MSLIRGTTPTYQFELPFQINLIKTAFVTFAQGEQIIVNRELTECQCEVNTLEITLTQKETLAFNTNDPIQIQIRVLDKGENALASEIWTEFAEDVLYEGVLT